MNKSGDKNSKSGSEIEETPGGDKIEGISLDLDFAPSWARTSPEEHIKSVKNSRFDRDDESYGRRDTRRGRRDSWRDDREERDKRRERTGDGKRGDRKPRDRNDQDRFNKSRTRREDSSSGGFSADSGSPQRRSDFHRDRQSETRGEGGHGGHRGHPRAEHPPLPLEIRVLPEQKALGNVIRRIQSSHRAFPLRDIAWLFLDKPASCLIRIAQQKEEPVPLFQCKVCGIPALSEDEIQNHLLNRHLDDFFEVEEIECEPPGGQFVCVMRCGISGELLGPPNHHSFNTKVHEMLRTKFPNMSEEAYRRKIESVREAEVIEEWRQSCTKKKIYRRKTAEKLPADETGENQVAVEKDAEPVITEDSGLSSAAVTEPVASEESSAVPAGEPGTDKTTDVSAEDNEVKAPPMERDVAELIFKREILLEQYAAVKHLVCIASTALQTPSKQLYFAIKDVIYKERRFPTSLFFALRGAFRHRKLYLFRAKEAKGPDFVMQKKPVELDPSHAVDMVKDVIAYIHENAACTKAEMVRALAGTDETKIKEVLGQLAWLIEKGNVIEYYNDVLSAPLEYPAFRILPGEKKRGGKQSESVAAAAVNSEETPESLDGDEAEKIAEPPVQIEEEQKNSEEPAPAEIESAEVKSTQEGTEETEKKTEDVSG